RTLRYRDALDADGETRGIHHDEHGVEPAVLLSDEVADGAVLLAELHDRGRAAVDAELVLETSADDVVPGAKRAVVVDEALRNQEERDAARTLGRVRQAREHEVHDVVGEVVIA